MALALVDSLPHQLSQDCALILASERLVERILHIGRHTEVHCGHEQLLLLNISTRG